MNFSLDSHNILEERSDMSEDSRGVITVIPAFNEEDLIKTVVNLTKKYVETIIVCNDGSSDNTEGILKENGVHHISHKKKQGKGASIRYLFKEAMKLEPDIIITMDADYQHDPSDIPKFIKEIRQNKMDIVIGSRFVPGSNTDISFMRMFGLSFINLIQRLLLKCDVRDTQSGFRAFSKRAFFVILESKENGYTTESEQLFLAAKHGLTVSEIPVTIRYKGLARTSKKHFMFHGLELVIFIIRYYLKNMSEIRRMNDKKKTN